MSKYTTEVRFICETMAGLDDSKGFNDIDSILTIACPKVFNFDFPIFDESYRLPLEKLILRHYYTREICEESVGLWKLRLQNRLCEIMPYFNKMYESTLLEFNPLDDVNLTKTHTNTVKDTDSGNVTTHNESNATRDGKSKSKFSDTPQGSISLLETDGYMTNATINELDETNGVESDGTSINSFNHDGTDNGTETIKGKMGLRSYSKMIQEYRNILISVDQQVIEALSDLFFGLW